MDILVVDTTMESKLLLLICVGRENCLDVDESAAGWPFAWSSSMMLEGTASRRCIRGGNMRQAGHKAAAWGICPQTEEDRKWSAINQLKYP